jgi:prepilin-type N-terminal cleavage/methylation domain-containing protein
MRRVSSRIGLGGSPEQRGVSLIELLVAAAILGIVVTVSLAVFFDRNRRMRESGEMIAAWQALANEAEVRRHMPYGQLPLGESGFVTETAVLAPLANAVALVEVTESNQVKTVALSVTWGVERQRSASMEVKRARLPGGRLF